MTITIEIPDSIAEKVIEANAKSAKERVRLMYAKKGQKITEEELERPSLEIVQETLRGQLLTVFENVAIQEMRKELRKQY